MGDTVAVAAETMADTVEGHIRIGRIIRLGFRVLFRNIGRFGLLALLLMAPFTLVDLFSAEEGVQSTQTVALPSAGEWLAIALLTAAYIVAYAFLTAAVTRGTYDELRSQRPSLMDCLRAALSRLLPVLLVGALLAWAWLLGTLALIVPGVIVLLMFYVAVPVAVVEKPGIRASFSRSRKLTKGNRWRILGVVVLYGLIAGLIQLLVGIVIGVLGYVAGNIPLAFILLNWASTAFNAVLFSTFVAVTYFALRVAKDGLDTDGLAAVFE